MITDAVNDLRVFIDDQELPIRVLGHRREFPGLSTMVEVDFRLGILDRIYTLRVFEGFLGDPMRLPRVLGLIQMWLNGVPEPGEVLRIRSSDLNVQDK